MGNIDENGLILYLNKHGIVPEHVKMHKVSNYLYYATVTFSSEVHLNICKDYILSLRELISPWLAFPDLFEGAPRWNQGYQEDYCIHYWLPYRKGLNSKQKDSYLCKYSCPEEWKDWLSDNDLI